jgi:hypothetical protein
MEFLKLLKELSGIIKEWSWVLPFIIIIYKIWKNRKIIYDYLSNLRENNYDNIQKFNNLIMPYKSTINHCWFGYTWFASKIIMCSGAILAFVSHFEGNSSYNTFIIFSLYFIMSYCIKGMGKFLKL